MSPPLPAIPLPHGITDKTVVSELHSLLDWRYALEGTTLATLHARSQAEQWNITELDWTQDVDLARSLSVTAGQDVGAYLNALLRPPVTLDCKQATELFCHFVSYMLSQFLHGEQGAMLTAAKLVHAAPSTDAKLCAASQTLDEARHVEVYHRYLSHKLPYGYAVHDQLDLLLQEILRASEWDLAFVGMQLLVEGLALAAFGLVRMLVPNEPLLMDIVRRVMRDESRHVAFGVMVLEKRYEQGLSERERSLREEFIVDGVAMLRARVSMEPVLERLGYTEPAWSAWLEQSPFLRSFRHMMFSNIVPNLRRINLMTPRVSSELERMDLLRFPRLPTSEDGAAQLPPNDILDALLPVLRAQRRAQRQR